MNKENLNFDFCDKFNYPEEIRAILKRAVEILSRYKIISVIALGSLPRGELSYKIKNGKLILFSDIELLVISRTKPSQNGRLAAIDSLRKIKKTFQPNNPLFEIAVEFLSLEEFRKLPFKVRFYELKERGETIFGQNLKPLMPRFNKQDLLTTDTYNIILRRLLYILLYFPKELLQEKNTASQQEVFKYVLSRNALDIATVVLYSKGIFLPSYKERVGHILANPDFFISQFGKDFPFFLDSCYKRKLNEETDQPLRELFEDTLKYFRILLEYVLKSNRVRLGSINTLLALTKRTKSDIFGESEIATAKLKFIARSTNLPIFNKRLKVVGSSLLGYIIFFLFSMNESLCLFLKSDRSCLSISDDSWWVLIKLGILNGKERLPTDFTNRFLALRNHFFSDFYVPIMQPGIKEQVQRLLNHRYE